MKDNDCLLIFGNNIRNIRVSQGLSQEELSFRANLHRNYIGMVERGERNISLKNIIKISKALNISIADLFYGL